MGSTSLSDSLQETLEIFDPGEPLTTQEVATELDLGRRTTYARLERLVEEEHLQTKKVGASARVWWRPQSSPDTASPEILVGYGAAVEPLIEALDEYAICALNADGYIQSGNPGIEAITGYEPDEVVGEHFSTFYPPDARADGLPDEHLSKAASHGLVDDEGWCVRADGERISGRTTIVRIEGAHDGELGFLAILRDGTDRRRKGQALRGQLEFTERLLEAAPAGVLLVEQDGTFSAANERAGELLDLEPTADGTQRVGIKAVYDAEGQFLPPDERPYVKIFDDGEPVRDWHAQVELSDGSRRWLSTNIEPILDQDGTVQQAVITIQDISRLKAQADRLHRQREELQEELDEIFARVDDAFLALDEDWRITYVNDRAAELVGLAPGELVGAQVWDVLYELEDGEPRELAEHAMASLEPVEFEYYSEILEAWFEVRGYPSETGLSVYFRDITERKERERERQQYQALVDAARDAAVLIDVDGTFRLVNDAFAEGVGVPKDELIGAPASILVERGVIDEAVIDTATEKVIDLLFSDVEQTQFEATLDSPVHGEMIVEANVSFLPPESDEQLVGGALALIRPITERKEREKRLQRYRTLTRSAQDVIVAIDEESVIREVNAAVEDVFGYAPEALIGEPITQLMTDEVAEQHRDGMNRYLETGERTLDWSNVEMQGLRADGTGVPLQITYGESSFEDEQFFTGIIRDITEQKARQRALRESEERYRTLAENFPDGVVGLFDEELRYTAVGGELLKDLGIPPEEPIGESIFERYPDELVEQIEPYFEGALEGKAGSLEVEYYDRHLYAHVLPVGDEDIIAGMLVVQDMTERKEREQELRQTKSQLEAATKAGGVGTWEWSLAEDRFLPDKRFAELFGVDPDTAREGVSVEEFLAAIHSADRDRVEASIEASIEGCTEYEEEYRVWDANDELRWVRSRGRVECDADGTPLAFPGALIDITTRKRTELELERQRERLAALNSLSNVVLEITDTVFAQSTREEIEQTVCDALGTAEAFEFAWIAGGDPEASTYEPRTSATVGTHDDAVTGNRIKDLLSESGPAATAIETGQTQIIRDVHGDPDIEPGPAVAVEQDVRALALIPIVHDEFVYGVLGVEAGRENAFDAEEREVVSRLGEILGHAISSAQRKQALMSEDIVELEFRIPDLRDRLDADIEMEGTISLEHSVPISDDQFLIYGTATADALSGLERLVDAIPHWEAVTIRKRGEPTAFELRTTSPPVFSAVSAAGGYFEGSVIEDGEIHLTVHLAPSVEIRRIIDVVEEAYPQAEMLSRRQITRGPDDLRPIQHRIVETLTERQQAALKAAFHAGYFEWPRETAGEEVAASLGIAPATFSQHLRKAEQQLFEALLSPTAQTGT